MSKNMNGVDSYPYRDAQWNPMPEPKSLNTLRPRDESGSKIRDGVTQLEEQLTELHGLVTSLEIRLDTVISPVPPQPASPASTAGKDIPTPMSHLYERVISLNNGLRELRSRLEHLQSRVEV